MEKNEIQKNQINKADYIDITVFIRSFLRHARRNLLLVCPIILCLIAGIGLLSRALVKEQYVAEASFVVGVTLLDDLSYNYTLPEIRDDYVVQMSEAFQSVVKSEYMYYLIQDELGRDIPGDINWENAYGTNMGGIYAVSDSMENAEKLRDAVIACLPKALFTTLGDIELKVIESSGRMEVLHEKLNSPLIWIGSSVVGGILAYFGIIFILTLWRHDIEDLKTMVEITDIPCLGRLPKSRKTSKDIRSDNIRSSGTDDEYSRSFAEFRRQLTDIIKKQQIKTLLFTGGYKKRGQKDILDKLYYDWISQGMKVQCIDMDLSKVPKTMGQIREEMDLYIEENSKDADLLIINGPEYEQTIDLLTLADYADGIVYVIKAGYDQIGITKEAICTLEFSQAELLGYVITV